jgi:cell wall-associated NlpC family hydrolase
MNCKKSFCAVLFLMFLSAFGVATNAQVIQRPRIVQNPNAPQTSPALPTDLVKTTASQRPTLTNKIVLSDSYINQASLIKKTGSSAPTNPAAANFAFALFNQRLSQAMDARLGIRYHYGATGENGIDCSGLVWRVFQEAGINFERTSAVNYWREFEPVSGDDRFKFGTLVFFNDLGHVGIVVNEKGFYHASSSKGVTYSSFDDYWQKRIVGFRRIPMKIS